MKRSMIRGTSRGTEAVSFIEDFCVIHAGQRHGDQVRLTEPQRDIVRMIYDSPNGPGFDSVAHIDPPLAAYLTLLHLCGPEYRSPPPKNPADIFTLWSVAGPRLRQYLKRQGDAVTCPELGTHWPTAA
jgi:hypothetical protein